MLLVLRLVGSEAQPTVAVMGAGVHLHVGLTWPTSEGGVHVHTLPRRVAASPQVLRIWVWEGLARWELVGRGVACCGLLCFQVGEFGEFCTSLCFTEESRYGGAFSDPGDSAQMQSES